MTVESRVETRVQGVCDCGPNKCSSCVKYNFQQQESCRGAAVCLAHVTPGQDNVGQAKKTGYFRAYMV